VDRRIVEEALEEARTTTSWRAIRRPGQLVGQAAIDWGLSVYQMLQNIPMDEYTGRDVVVLDGRGYGTLGRGEVTVGILVPPVSYQQLTFADRTTYSLSGVHEVIVRRTTQGVNE